MLTNPDFPATIASLVHAPLIEYTTFGQRRVWTTTCPNCNVANGLFMWRRYNSDWPSIWSSVTGRWQDPTGWNYACYAACSNAAVSDGLRRIGVALPGRPRIVTPDTPVDQPTLGMHKARALWHNDFITPSLDHRLDIRLGNLPWGPRDQLLKIRYEDPNTLLVAEPLLNPPYWGGAHDVCGLRLTYWRKDSNYDNSYRPFKVQGRIKVRVMGRRLFCATPLLARGHANPGTGFVVGVGVEETMSAMQRGSVAAGLSAAAHSDIDSIVVRPSATLYAAQTRYYEGRPSIVEPSLPGGLPTIAEQQGGHSLTRVETGETITINTTGSITAPNPTTNIATYGSLHREDIHERRQWAMASPSLEPAHQEFVVIADGIGAAPDRRRRGQ